MYEIKEKHESNDKQWRIIYEFFFVLDPCVHFVVFVEMLLNYSCLFVCLVSKSVLIPWLVQVTRGQGVRESIKKFLL